MKIFKILSASFALVWAVSASAWDAQVCNQSNQVITVKISVAAADGFSITTQPHSVSPPRSVAGLCINGVTAINESANPPHVIYMRGEGWGGCSNANVFIEDYQGQPYGHYVRTSAGLRCSPAAAKEEE